MPGIEIALEQNNRRQPVHRFGALFNADAALSKHALRRYRGETLIPKLHRNAAGGPEALSKVASIFSLPTFPAAHMQWIPHQYKRDVFLRGKLRNPRHVLAYIGPLQRFEALSGCTQLVAQRQPNPLLAEIQRQYPALNHENSRRVRLPSPT